MPSRNKTAGPLVKKSREVVFQDVVVPSSAGVNRAENAGEPHTGGRIDVLMIAGEHSGDAHAAEAVQELWELRPDAQVVAIGGPALGRAGVPLLFDLTAFSVVGVVEVLRHYRFFVNLMEATVAWIAQHRPRLVCLVDYPGFNLRLAKRLAEEGLSVAGGGSIRVCAYIGPQLWAWKAHRRFAMAKLLQSLAVIFPFEKAVYADTSLPVTVVQHPLAKRGKTARFCYREGGPILLLPGSRAQPVSRIFPRMLAAVAQWQRQSADGALPRRVVALYPSPAIGSQLRALVAASGLEIALEPMEPTTANRFLESSSEEVPFGVGHRVNSKTTSHLAAAALMSSGTVSLEVAWAGVPGVLIYVAHPVTYLLGRALVKVPFLGMANLLLGRSVIPEFIQNAASPARLATALAGVLRNEPTRPEESEENAALPTRAAAAETAAALHRLLCDADLPSAGVWLAAQFSSEATR